MDFVEMMRLRGQAAENIYFAQRDRELIDELHAHPEKLQNPPQIRVIVKPMITAIQTAIKRGDADAAIVHCGSDSDPHSCILAQSSGLAAQ